MTPVLLLLVLLLLLVGTARAVLLDGYGGRPPLPRPDDDPRLPSRPYALR